VRPGAGKQSGSSRARQTTIGYCGGTVGSRSLCQAPAWHRRKRLQPLTTGASWQSGATLEIRPSPRRNA